MHALLAVSLHEKVMNPKRVTAALEGQVRLAPPDVLIEEPLERLGPASSPLATWRPRRSRMQYAISRLCTSRPIV
jgi:hypothetical protein